MEEKGLWAKRIALKDLIVVGVVSALVGLGLSGSLGWLSSGRPINVQLAVRKPVPLPQPRGCLILSSCRKRSARW